MNRITEMQAQVFKALGHPSRLAMVQALAEGEQCVCELTELVGKDVSTVSKHLSVLKAAGIVSDSRRGTNVYYTLEMNCLGTFLDCLDGFLRTRAGAELEAVGAPGLAQYEG